LPQLAIDGKEIDSQYGAMAQNWTARVTRSARHLGRVFRTSPRMAGSSGCTDDADARRMSADLDAIRARFPDHA
jgi:hypothetical protein